MFGHVRPNLEALSEAEKARYKAVYCGLCRVLGDRHGFKGRMSLTYDLTFLKLLLQSLYEPAEEIGQARCISHPKKPHDEAVSVVDDYAADMTVALMYHKLLDDWLDDRDLVRRGAAKLLESDYARVRSAWPAQCEAIEQCLHALAAIERDPNPQPDTAANCFGALMGALFLWKRDFWSGTLYAFGQSLGRFIYMMDAAVDYRRDVKKHAYNPLEALGVAPQDAKPLLMQTLGPAAQALEELPLVQDAGLLRNILYSGVWQIYNTEMQKEADKHGE